MSVTKLCIHVQLSGQGVFPSVDVDGHHLSTPWAGQRIAGHFRIVLDAFQMDQEFVSKCFNLQSRSPGSVVIVFPEPFAPQCQETTPESFAATIARLTCVNTLLRV